MQKVLALDQKAKPNVKVLVVANPANTNCLTALKLSTRIPPRNFSCLTRLDHERLRGAIQEKINADYSDLNLKSVDIKNVCIFGNHSTTQVPFIDSAIVRVSDDWIPVSSFISDSWKNEILPERIQLRGGEILKAQQASSGMSAAIAISRHLKDWLGQVPASPADEYFSMGVISNGNPYGVPDGLIYSFPVRKVVGGAFGDIEIVPNLPISNSIRNMINDTTNELLSERNEAESILGISLTL